MPALITFEELVARPGFDGVDQATAEAVIIDASALVADIAAPTALTAATLPAGIVPVLVAMVRRGLFNPRGLSSEQLGDYGWQAGGQSSTGMYATRVETRIIRRAAGTLSVGTLTLKGDLPLTPGYGAGYENEFLESL